jgi:hypothetical protein
MSQLRANEEFGGTMPSPAVPAEGLFDAEPFPDAITRATGQLATLQARELIEGRIARLQDGFYHKRYINGLVFKGSRAPQEVRRVLFALLSQDSRVDECFEVDGKSCYRLSFQPPGSPESRFIDTLQQTIVPEAVDQLYAEYGSRGLHLGHVAQKVIKLTGMEINFGDAGVAQPWESVKLLTCAHPRVTSLQSKDAGTRGLWIAPPLSEGEAPTP